MDTHNIPYPTGVLPLHQVHKPPFTIESPGCEKVPGETIPRRHPKAKDGLIARPAEGINTVFDIVQRSARVYPDRGGIGSRKLIELHEEVKTVKQKKADGQTKEIEKKWQYFELSGYSFISFKEYETLVLQLGSGLRKLGLSPVQKLHFFGATSMNWLAMSHACASQSISIVTAYDTLGEEGFQHTLVQTQSDAIFIDPHLLKIATNPLKKSNVKTVIVNDACIFGHPNDMENFAAANPEFKVLTVEQLRSLGENNMVDPVPAKPTDLFCIMYTSGSAGPPKGACITHEVLVAGVAGIYTSVDEVVSYRDTLLCYLPLAHIFELTVENLAIFIGGTLGYGSSRTLSDASTRNCAGDMKELGPTIMMGVPQVWETIRKGINAKLEASALLKNAFWAALNFKSFMSRYRLPGANIFDKIIFGKVRDLAGGRVRFTVNGASGIAEGTKHVISHVIAPMIIGYGLTETCACGALGSPLEFALDTLGPVAGSLEIKLVSVPEFGYSTDAKVPQGEIWARGTSLMKGYYNNPEETEKAITPDGWFKTGDVGEFDADGHLRVIDRIKNLIKLQGGEYIALEKLESIYRGARTVMNVMVHADPAHSRPIAVIMPEVKALMSIAEGLGVDEHDMYHDPRVKEAVLEDLRATGKSGGLAAMELVAGVVLTHDEWTPHSGLVTATQKLNRRVIIETFKKEIAAVLKDTP
ncbi:AMP-binding domain-containing protein [Fusarium falciforme]|uniref:AMP-binding domain-containing protein n=1 Tax=Fusarium falciforme TaxID=195108 RepID=UPI002301462D|nr:AMP-binding domain-containing protein [Fusarium falciforme]WAO89025.1 AMP-binding domain-containing protein [Fusarium falciforme]